MHFYLFFAKGMKSSRYFKLTCNYFCKLHIPLMYTQTFKSTCENTTSVLHPILKKILVKLSKNYLNILQ